MILNADPVPLSSISRRERPTPFDFAESAARSGSAFQLEGGGHFIVAGPDSLLPKFVVEVDLRTKGDVEYYNAALTAMNEVSCGFMWFDDHDVQAFDLAFRMRLPLIAMSAMLELQPEQAPAPREGFDLRSAVAQDHGPLTMLLGTLSPRMGGLTPSQASDLLNKGDVTVLSHDGAPIGTVVSSRTTDGALYAHAFSVAPEFQGAGVGKWFMHNLVSRSEGRPVRFGVANNNPAEMWGALKLGAKIVNRGWRAQLGSI